MRPISKAAIPILLVLSFGSTASLADFTIAASSYSETSPSVAGNTLLDEFAVASLVPGAQGPYVEVRIFDSEGSQQGSTKIPLGTGIVALGRPEIVYNSVRNQYLVAVAVDGTSDDDILVRRLDADGNSLIGPDFLFTDLMRRIYYDTQGVSGVRVTHNILLDEYFVTAQIDTGPSTPQVAVWGTRVAGDTSWIGTSTKLTPDISDLWTHSIAHAPISTTTYGGHYLLATSQSHNGYSYLYMLDANGSVIVNNLPFDWGAPDWGCGYADVAYGVVHNQHKFLVTWADGDNHKPGDPTFEWTGIWGSYLDPFYTGYTPGVPENDPFPISLIWSHKGTFQPYKFRVSHNWSAQMFFVAWHEEPANIPQNDPNRCTHIRGNWVDYPVHNPTEHPYQNAVVSEDTCNCLPQPSGPLFCESDENPRMPDIAQLGSGKAVVVWQENYPPFPSDQDLAGDFFGYEVPYNDSWLTPIVIPDTGGTIECTLLSATQDGGASCGGTTEPDVWYEFTAPRNGVLHAFTCGTNDMFGTDTGMDTVLSIHEPAHADQIDLNACNDDYVSWPPGDVCAGSDQGLPRDSYVSWPMPAGETFLLRVSRYDTSTGGHCLFHAEFEIGGGGAGRVGDPLLAEKLPNGEIALFWGPSCLASDTDYEVYEGVLGNFATHEPRICSTNGDRAVAFTPGPGSHYYLVVPNNGTFEGSYGLSSNGSERPVGPAQCMPRNMNPC